MRTKCSAKTLPNWQRNTRLDFACLASSYVRFQMVSARIRVILIGLGVLFLIASVGAQVPSPPQSNDMKVKCGGHVRSTYLLGPDDQLEISGPELTELANKPVRVDSDGNIEVPLGGRVYVAGLTAQQTEQEVNKVLSKYIRQPQIVVSIAEVRSQPVSIIGAVNTPGVKCWHLPAGSGRTQGTAFGLLGNWSGAASRCQKRGWIPRVSLAWPNST